MFERVLASLLTLCGVTEAARRAPLPAMGLLRAEALLAARHGRLDGGGAWSSLCTPPIWREFNAARCNLVSLYWYRALAALLYPLNTVPLHSTVGLLKTSRYIRTRLIFGGLCMTPV